MSLLPTHPAPFKHSSHEKGSALIITLSFVILLSIVVVGYLTTSGNEQRISKTHTGKIEANLYSTIATEVAAARLAKATDRGEDATYPPDPNDRKGNWWISQPGQIANTPYKSPQGISVRPESTLFDLSSGAASAVTKDLSVDLSPVALTKPYGLLIGDPSKRLPVNWVYVTENGEHLSDLTAVPAYNSDNPIVGRYAFWTDDETARINLNTATLSTDPASESSNHPSKLDLEYITPLSEDDITVIRTQRAIAPFNSLEEIKKADVDSPTIAEALSSHRESLTHFSTSTKPHVEILPPLPSANPPLPLDKLVLTTNKAYANGRPFLDIFEDAYYSANNFDPGIHQRIVNGGAKDYIDAVKVERLVNNLYRYLNTRQAWEYGLVESSSGAGNLYNKTFGAKYTPAGTAQIILNIIDYVRSVESPSALVQPLRGAFLNGVFTYRGSGVNSYNGVNGLIGNSRRIHIVEMGVWIPEQHESQEVNPVSGEVVNVFNATTKLRLHLPESAVNSFKLTGQDGIIPNVLVNYNRTDGGTPGSPDANFNITWEMIEGATQHDASTHMIAPGGYRTIKFNHKIKQKDGEDRIKRLSLRAAFQDNTFSPALSYILAPVDANATPDSKILFNIDPVGVDVESMSSASINDPAIYQNAEDWGIGSSKFGLDSSEAKTARNTLGQGPTTGPSDFNYQQDTDASNNLTDISTLPPSPKGTPSNPLGRVQSVAELGRIHSGGRGNPLPGVSWRTLRLQPRNGTINAMLPDWILFEVFEAPNTATPALFDEKTRAIQGKMNLNQRLAPFSGPNAYQRTLPLTTLLRSASPSITDTEAATLVDNIIQKRSVRLNYGTTQIVNASLYSLPGEICEIVGIADKGEETEKNLLGLVDHLTTSSNVFSVYSVGQKIKQLPNSKIEVLGETRTSTLMELQPDGTLRAIQTTELGE